MKATIRFAYGLVGLILCSLLINSCDRKGDYDGIYPDVRFTCIDKDGKNLLESMTEEQKVEVELIPNGNVRLLRGFVRQNCIEIWYRFVRRRKGKWRQIADFKVKLPEVYGDYEPRIRVDCMMVGVIKKEMKVFVDGFPAQYINGVVNIPPK